MQVYLNGNILPAREAKVGIDDAGFTHAVGLFETMQAFQGTVFRLPQHLERLRTSARELGLAPDLDLGELSRAVQDTLEANGRPDARLRLTVTAGEVSLLRPADKKAPRPTVLVTAGPPTAYDPAYFTQGITVVIVPPAANPFDPTHGHKTLAYWQRLRTLRQAAAVGAGEALWLNISNHLASGAVSNLFLVKDGRLLTPFARGEEVQGALPAPVLPGITRAAILELAEELEIPAQRQMLSAQDLVEADEVFLTNSSWLVLPVTRVEKKTIGSGQVGEITNRLRAALAELIRKETAG